MARIRIGIDLGGTKIEGVALVSGGSELFRRRVSSPSGDYDATVEAVANLVADIERQAGAQGSVGVGIPGAVSPATGRVKNANSTWLIGRRFDQDLATALDRPVRLANDADCFALSEATDGAGAGAAIVFGAILGTGVGGGIVIDGKLVAGPNAIAGEWGHNPLPWPDEDEHEGPPCYCGRKGCIETFLSGPGLARDFKAATGRRLDPSAIAVAADSDAATKAALDRYARRLARALATVINILDPHVVVLGGGLSNLECLYRAVPRLWAPFVFSDRVATRLVRNRHGDSSGVRGAARLWPAEATP